MKYLFYIFLMYATCVIFHKPGWKFFMLWLLVCAGVFYFVHEAVGIWGFLGYFFIDVDTEKSDTSSSASYHTDFKSNAIIGRDQHNGTGYDPGGDITYLPNGGSAVRSGNNTYLSNGIVSLKCGEVTYYFDPFGKRLGRSVSNGNGVYYYFDDNGREIGHSFSDGSYADFFGDCYECR